MTSNHSDLEKTLFKSNIEGYIPWHYEIASGSICRLYELAKSRAWNASTDIPKENFCRETHFPCSRQSNPLSEFPAYEALSNTEQRQLSWWQHGLEISEILHGEQGALLLASQLLTGLPGHEEKLFLSSQVADEARHVEFFSRYLSETVGAIYPPSKELRNLLTSTLEDTRWEMKLIICQVLIESLAMARFQELRRNVRAPLLQFGIDYILRDEARHVRFGTEYLQQQAASLDPESREERCRCVIDAAISLAGSLNIYTRIAERMAWDPHALRQHLRIFRAQHPEMNRERFRQLVLNLKAVGLYTDQCHSRLESMNLMP